MTWRDSGLRIFVVSATAVLSCVPVLRYLPDDASTDGPDQTQSMDGSDALEPDASDGGCSGSQQGATVCCGTIWCVGECDANCGKCATCTPGLYCCDRGGMFKINCRTPGSTCM